MNSIKHLIYTLAGGTLTFMLIVGFSKVIESVHS